MILETLGTILLFACILGIENFTRSIFFMIVGFCLMVLPLINSSDDDQKTKTLEQKPLTKIQKMVAMVGMFILVLLVAITFVGNFFGVM